MKKLPKILLLVFLMVASGQLLATHNRAGEITYTCLGGFTYEAKIVTYTYTPSPADRPQLTISWGDGDVDTIPRIEEIFYPDDIKRNVYIGRHTYPGPSTYIISFEDPNRNAGVLNIPNSVNVPFYVESMLIINPFLGNNNSPQLLNPPIDNACVGQIFIHNPGAYDVDGDSLSYRLVICKGENGYNIPGYSYPWASSSFTLDPVTGDLVWDTPIQQGEYNVALIIEEWRKGVLIGYVTRDMQINVVACNNRKPEIAAINDTCVNAGTLININVSATDPDVNDILTLTGNGLPLMLSNSPAQFTQPASGTGSVSSAFVWQTNCLHVRKQPYTMTFKVIDNGVPVKLVDYETFNITVVGPAPKNLTATPFANSIILNWEKSECDNAVGYRIFRRNGFYGYIPAHCETGVPAYTGYYKIADIPDINTTTYTDNNNGYGLPHGTDFCYMVIAYYPDNAESYASNEACAKLLKDVPVITNVSIRNTSQTDGSVYVAWSKPTELDTIQQHTGPFEYRIFRDYGYYSTSLSQVHTNFGLNDTLFVDTLLNTATKPVCYRIDLYNNAPGNTYLIGSSLVASSVFLSIQPLDNKLQLNWKENVQWTNSIYYIYKEDLSTGNFFLLDSATQSPYTDTGLVNGVNYCYYVVSKGKYGSGNFVTPIINYSEIACATPADVEPPCPPELTVTPDCKKVENLLVWTNPNHHCADDVVAYNVYYAPNSLSTMTLLFSTTHLNDTTFLHTGLPSIAGCYLVTAVDSAGNESDRTQKICVDVKVCNESNPSNIFTPDGDGKDDYFMPFPSSFVGKLRLLIYNRWGNLVFEGENANAKWDGKNQTTGLECSEGVYYYICLINELGLSGEINREIKGFVYLYRKN